MFPLRSNDYIRGKNYSAFHRACSGEKTVRYSLPSYPVIVAKFVIPVLLYHIVTLIVAANWEMGPGDTYGCVTGWVGGIGSGKEL